MRATPLTRSGAPSSLLAALLVLVVLALTVGMLAPEQASAEMAPSVTPPEIAYGESRCANCSMFVREPDHAAALVTEDGWAAFCDMGCLLIAMNRDYPDGAGVEATFVRDWSSGQWIEGRAAFFAQADLWTPMRFGLFAFEERAAAHRFAEEHQGRTLTWEEATHNVVETMMERKGHGGHHGGH